MSEVSWLRRIPSHSKACIIHRDVHGANLIETGAGALRLIDFEFLQVCAVPTAPAAFFPRLQQPPDQQRAPLPARRVAMRRGARRVQVAPRAFDVANFHLECAFDEESERFDWRLLPTTTQKLDFATA